jgi:plastocyanin
MSFERTIGWFLGVGAVVFVLLLGGAFSGALTDDPPRVNPYAAGSDEPDSSTETTATTSAEAPTTAPTAAPAAIDIEGFDFGEPITVAVGQTVVVTNLDGAPHTFTDRGGAFDSGSIGTGGGTFEVAIDTPGTYEFFCSIHPSMTGSLTVQG